MGKTYNREGNVITIRDSNSYNYDHLSEDFVYYAHSTSLKQLIDNNKRISEMHKKNTESTKNPWQLLEG